MRRVVAGACHTIALTGSGQVYAFGQGTFGALGLGNEENADAPQMLQRLWPIGIVQVRQAAVA
jgi:E3 ubiquitin-protein ligase HERC4